VDTFDVRFVAVSLLKRLVIGEKSKRESRGRADNDTDATRTDASTVRRSSAGVAREVSRFRLQYAGTYHTDLTVHGASHVARTPLLALLGSTIVSLAGSTVTAIALPWFVLETTGSAAMTGVAAFFVAVPAVLTGVFGGAFVDRLGSRRVSIAADVVSGSAIAAIPALHATVGLAFGPLLGLIFLGSLLTLPGLTARRIMLPELAARAGMRLDRLNAAFESAQFLAALLGPPLAGLLISIIGAANVLWIDAASFAISALAVAVAIPGAPAVARANEPYLTAVAAGLRFLRRDVLLRTLLISLAITNGLRDPLLAVMVPVFALKEYGEATILGLLVATNGLGAFVGTVLYGIVGYRLPRRATWIGAYALNTLPFWALATGAPLWALIGAMLVNGVVSGPISPLVVTVRHERIPTSLQGRVFGLFSAMTRVASPIGVLVAGALIGFIGLRPALVVWAATAQLVALGMVFIPALHALNERVNHTTSDNDS